jgi:hypothetical protein
MDSLGYQNPDDTRREIRADWKLRTFGISRQEIWRGFADDIGARYEPAGWRKSDRVVLDLTPWQIVLDIYLHENFIFTRLRAAFVTAAGMRFRTYRQTPWGTLRKALGMRDIEIGDPPFDDEFIVRSNQPEKIVALLANESIRTHLLTQTYSQLEIRDNDGRRGPRYPANVDSLWFSTADRIDDPGRLRASFDLVAETLNQLVAIGAATQDVPGVQL